MVYHRLGMALGLEASRVALGLRTRPVERRFSHVQGSGAPLGIYEEAPVAEADCRLMVRTCTARLPVGEARPLDALEAEAEQAREKLARVRASGGPADEVRAATMTAKRAAAQASRARMIAGKTHLEMEVQAICVGDIALVGVPGEPFGEIGTAIKARSPFAHTLFSGYSNGSTSSIPTAEAHAEGGYEVGVSPYAPEAADTLIETVVAFLEEISG